MKSYKSLATIALLALSSSAFAVPIPLGTVGGADTLVAHASLSNSSDASERAFIAGYLGITPAEVTYYNHLSGAESGGASGEWDTVIGDSSLYAFNFGDITPAYFLIRTGSGVGLPELPGTYTHFLYENVAALSYGVIDLDMFTRTHGRVEIAMVSHVSTAGDGGRSVPEPATLGLMGIALAGLGFAGRRKKTV